MNIALVCGGPSAERGISINSARSMLDHLQSEGIKVTPIYFDVFMNSYVLSPHQLYSNTPSDFDFKLKDSAQKISQEELVQLLKTQNLVFPLIHGLHGEDGELQTLLEDNDIPYIGGTAEAYRKGFPKASANSVLKEHGFFTLPFAVVDRTDTNTARDTLTKFFKKHKLTEAILKPSRGGSSIGVTAVKTADEAIAALEKSVTQGLNVGNEYILEPYCHGREFSCIVLESKNGNPVAFVPTEIENLKGTDIYDYRGKYLPTNDHFLHCPPHLSDAQIGEIQEGAEKIFSLFGFRDFMRVDGWVLDNGKILFSDINPVSGMEQNSILFQLASRFGFTHRSLLQYILSNACQRYGIQPPTLVDDKASSVEKEVHVLMGGKTAERQVSLMSGTNVCLKLMRSERFRPVPYLMDTAGVVWRLPYSFMLNHTVEEIRQNCGEAETINRRLAPYAEAIYRKLDLPNGFSIEANTPISMSLDAFCDKAEKNDAFVFIALHGGEGEDGRLQQKLESYGLVYNGSDSDGSKICMDKYTTGLLVNALKDKDIRSLPKIQFNIQTATEAKLDAVWDEASRFGMGDIAIKPLSDGCSSGIVRLYSREDLHEYAKIASNKKNEGIPAGTFKNQDNEVALPQDRNPNYILEPFIQVDYLRVKKNDIVYTKKDGLLEFTVGVLEEDGVYHALNPSITIAESEVLSLEEKFQGGTGVNITPPPDNILSPKNRKKICASIEKVAKQLLIRNYARIDVFCDVNDGKMIVIEANSLPGLTPSTVIYHQGLAEQKPLVPLAFIEKIIQSKIDTVEHEQRQKVAFGKNSRSEETDVRFG